LFDPRLPRFTDGHNAYDSSNADAFAVSEKVRAMWSRMV
jgi:hypothetical protein